METFEFFGLEYVILEDKENEVALKCAKGLRGRAIIPKKVEFNGESYIVTKIGHESRQMVVDITLKPGTGIRDKRRKDGWNVKPIYLAKSYAACGPFNFTFSAQYIGEYGYNDGKGEIESIVLPDSITELSEGAFRDCTKLTNIELPTKIVTIPARAFKDCVALEHCSLHEGIVSIGRGAFWGCENLKEISIPSSVKIIDNYAFYGCKIKEISIPSSVETIGDNAFGNLLICDGADVVNIYNDEGNVIIHPSAFSSRTKVNYLGIKKEKSNPTASISEEKGIDLDKLINAVVADGIVTDKERAVILKKATAAGYDADEVEIILDAHLYEKQVAQKPTEKQVEKKNPVGKPAKEEVSKPEKEVALKVADDSTVEWSESLWEPVKAELLKQVKVKMSIPKGKPYAILSSENHKGLLQYILQYSVREGEAIVRLETYGGEEAKNKFDAKIAATPAGHPLKESIISQGQKNKDKWAWTIVMKVDKSDSGLVRWYADTLLAAYAFMEDITL